MDSNLFDCSFCASEDVVDADSMPSECRLCYREQCNACVNDEWVCVPCE